MAVTPDFNLPYPEPNSTADVPRDFKALAEAVEAALKDLGVDVLDVFDSTDKTLPPSADALRRGLETKQNVLRLADNYLAASVLVNAAPDGSGRSYPDGVSMFKVSSSAGGWPTANGYVLTFRAGSGGYQIFYEMYTGAVASDKTARQWTRSKRDSNSFWQDWARAATEVDIATLLPLAGGDMTGAISRTHGASNVREYINLDATYVGGSVTGAFRILLPTRRTNTELTVIIEGYNHAAAGGYWRAEISFYAANSTSTPFLYPNAVISGNAPFSAITLAEDGANAVIILGGVTTQWISPSISIAKVIAGSSTVSVWGFGWLLSVVTDISTLTNAVQPTLQKLATQAYADAAVATHAADYVRQPGYAATAGTGAAYTVTLSPAPAALVDGLAITIVPHTDNTAADPTLKIGSLAALPIRRQSGAQFAAGSIKAGQPLSLIKVGSYFLARSAAPFGNATAAQVLAGYTFQSAAVPDGGTGTLVLPTPSSVNTNYNSDPAANSSTVLFTMPAGTSLYLASRYTSDGSQLLLFTASNSTSFPYFAISDGTHEIAIRPNYTFSANINGIFLDLYAKQAYLSNAQTSGSNAVVASVSLAGLDTTKPLSFILRGGTSSGYYVRAICNWSYA